MTVAEAQEKIDSQEFASWLAYDRIDPFGNERGDMQAAIVSVTMANAWCGKAKPFTLDDFMLRFGEESTRQQTPEEMFAILMAPGQKM